MVRSCRVDKNGMKKGSWSVEEDEKLRAYVHRYGHWNWRQLPKFAGLVRCGKSCRLRWMNYLRPGVKRRNYSQEENELILMLHKKFGNKWSLIAKSVPGRTDHEIKNYWHTHLHKLAKRSPPTSESSQVVESAEKENQRVEKIPDKKEEKREMAYSGNTDYNNVAAAAAASDDAWSPSSRAFADADSIEEFWTQPFLPDNDNTINISVCHSGFLSPHSQITTEEFFVAYDLYCDDQASYFSW